MSKGGSIPVSAIVREIENEVATGKIRFIDIENPLSAPKPINGDPDITISELIKVYLQWLEINRAPSTRDLKKYLLTHFDRRYGQLMVSEITQILLSEYYAWARKERGTSKNGGNHHMREVKSLLLWGVDMDLCMMPVRKFPAMRQSPPKTKKFTDQELVLLLKKDTPDFRDMILFGILTGLRPQEMRALTRNHIQEQNGGSFIIMEHHKTSMSARTPKPRCVPLSLQALDILERQLDRHPESEYIFISQHGKPYTASGFRSHLERSCVRIGIPKRSPYALRHYFGTKQAGSGLNQTILMQVMGHTTPATAMRYVDEVPEYQQKAMDSMAHNMAFLLDDNPVDSPVVEPPQPPQLRLFPEPQEDEEDRVMEMGA